MPVAVSVWSLSVPPGDPVVITAPADIRITNVALGDEIEDQNSRTTLKMSYRAPTALDEEDEDEEDEDEEKDEEESDQPKILTAVLGSLTPSKIEQTTVDLTLLEDEEYLFEVVGKNTIHLTGNYIDQRGPDADPFSDEDSEDGYDLRDVSSDVEVYPDELDIPSDDEGRFEEIVDEEPPKDKENSKKRPRESDAMDIEEPSKSQKKKQKKQKGADGEATAVASQAEPPAEKTKKDKKDKKDKSEKAEKAKPDTKVLQGGVQVVDHKIGTGPKAKAGDLVSMRYVGKLQNGKVFDQNTKGNAFRFRLGKGEVIKGWDVGIAGMQVGGERLLTIPAPMAYGKKSQAGIPANSTLIFEVKLLEIKH